jgi:hypothetical protein
MAARDDVVRCDHNPCSDDLIRRAIADLNGEISGILQGHNLFLFVGLRFTPSEDGESIRQPY